MIVSRELIILFALAAEARLGPKAVAALLAHYGDPGAIWDTGIDEVAQVAHLSEAATERLVEARGLTDALAEELELIVDGGTMPLSILDDDYPDRLRHLPDPPTIVYVRGQMPDEVQTAVAVVGSHHADAEGIAEAVAWGKGLALRGAAVISGLARGIDGGGHMGALAAGGRTVAVLGSGFDNIYPPEHRVLAEQIEHQGALISEHPPRTPLTKSRLVYRNRMIVALSDAVVVVRVHAPESGTMEAVRQARDLARPVFMVAADASPATIRAVADGAIPIGHLPDFDLVLKYL
ncbi:MAG: DNA-protecting protein DprA [candidate division Zixibacteria bacterium]|nr:DNA-protecting protein DprA [candidate division Zixibacteria bacterium]